MARRVLLLEPDYDNKYPPMGLMKLATYFRRRGDDVWFFKGELRDLAVELLFQDFWSKASESLLSERADESRGYASPQDEARILSQLQGEHANQMRECIKTGRTAIFEFIPDFPGKKSLTEARARFQARDFRFFDVICVTTLFTFFWKDTIATINASKEFLKPGGRLLVGGIAASILSDLVEKETGIKPHFGLLDKPGVIDQDSEDVIDELPLDYSILEEIDYRYPAGNAYMGYMTRGCVRRCDFCTVPRIEPRYRPFISVKAQISESERRFGTRKDLLLLDNNVFASQRFDEIIDEIKEMGFGKGGPLFKPSNEYDVAVANIVGGYNVRAYLRKIVQIYDAIAAKLPESERGRFYIAREELGLLYEDTATPRAVLAFDSAAKAKYDALIHSKHNLSRGQTRYIDFNQGVDARLVTDAKMRKLAEVNIRPLRIAFDRWDEIPKGDSRPMHEIYGDAVRLAAKHGLRDLSNYLLYNSDEDTPDELYKRLDFNVRLCEELDVNIYSFPMKYHPIDDPEFFDNRNFTGRSWNRKYVRAVQAVLNSTHGKIGRGVSFFHAAFGRDLDEYHDILMMPEAFIIERHKYDRNAYQEYLDGGGRRPVKEDDLKACGHMADEWRRKFHALSKEQRSALDRVVHENVFNDATDVGDPQVRDVLRYYRIQRYEELPEVAVEDAGARARPVKRPRANAASPRLILAD